MTKSTLYSTMQLIAEILDFNDNPEALSDRIKKTSVDWDTFVTVGSKHLMLPALYCQLKAKRLLPLIPADLTIYLEEIASINRGRNTILLAEAREISELFNKEQINHVFIKGMALIAGHTFKDHAERMIGDIDILIAENQLNTAFDILTQHGYSDTVDSILERKRHRHLPRQISPEKFGAIELHSDILTYKYKHLITSDKVLNNKRIIDGIALPSLEDAIKTAVYAFQINDKAHLYGYFSFKTIYDCLALQLLTQPSLLKQLSEEKHSQSFLLISSVFFKGLQPWKSSLYSKLLKRYYTLSFQNSILGNLLHSLVKHLIFLHIRLLLVFKSQHYRSFILRNKTIIKNK